MRAAALDLAEKWSGVLASRIPSFPQGRQRGISRASSCLSRTCVGKRATVHVPMHRVTGKTRLWGDRSFPKALLMEFHHRLRTLVTPPASHLTTRLGARTWHTFSLWASLFLLHLLLPHRPLPWWLWCSGAFALLQSRYARAFAVHHPLHRVSPIGDQRGAVSDVDGVWGSLLGTLRRAAGAVTAHDLDTRVLTPPLRNGFGLPIRHEINRSGRVQIDQDRARMVSSSPRTIVYAQHLRRVEACRTRAAEHTTDGQETDRKTQKAGDARSCSASTRKSHFTQGLHLTRGPSCRSGSDRWKRLSKSLTRARPVRAENTTHTQPEPSALPLTGQSRTPPRVTTLETR